MGLRKTIGLIAAAILPWAGNGQALGGFVEEFTNKDEWIAAVGDFLTADFTGFPAGTFITDQYADLGILFTDGNDSIDVNAAHMNDGWGLDGNPDMHLSFDTPQAYVAVHFPGDVQIDLFSGDIFIHSSVFIAGGLGNFGGVISSQLFDAVVISDPVFGDVFIDDLHFGVPAPPTVALLALASLFCARSRRRSGVTGPASTED